jgi:hypothetical protein
MPLCFCYAESHYAECCFSLIVVLNVIMMNVVMLNVAAPLQLPTWPMPIKNKTGHYLQNPFCIRHRGPYDEAAQGDVGSRLGKHDRLGDPDVNVTERFCFVTDP